ncbi:hypothetical protein C8R44DRAFT_863477 [Mycena epipterygia]|nr:hypothetical protein C8R44DRAFT_863477 [Mycena epipterygia]
MSDISPVQTLLVLVSLIPNNNIRYTMLGLAAGITAFYVVHLERPSVRLAHLENSVGCAEDIICEAKSLCPRDHLSLTETEVCLLKICRSMCNLRSTLLHMPGMGWTLEGVKNYLRLRGDIYQCEKEVKRIRVTVQLAVEAERQRKYTEDIRETQAIIRAVQDSLGQAAWYNQPGGAVYLDHHVYGSFRSVFYPAAVVMRIAEARTVSDSLLVFAFIRALDLCFAISFGIASHLVSLVGHFTSFIRGISVSEQRDIHPIMALAEYIDN